MSRKDYIAIAALLKRQMLLAPFVHGIACQLCEVFKADNPLFDHAKFLTACGIDSKFSMRGKRNENHSSLN